MRKERWLMMLAAGLLLGAVTGRLYAIAEEEEGEGTADRKAVITYVRGGVDKKATAQADWSTAAKSDKVITGDKVRTKQESRSEIRLADRTIIRMEDSSQITLADLEAKGDAEKTAIKLEQGKVWATVAKLSSEDDFSVSSQVAGASIRGTTFSMTVGKNGQTQIKVYRGQVEVYNPFAGREGQGGAELGAHEVQGPQEVAPDFKEVSREEWVYLVGRQQQITIGGDGQLVSKGKFSEKSDDEWVRWNKEMDLKQGLYKK